MSLFYNLFAISVLSFSVLFTPSTSAANGSQATVFPPGAQTWNDVAMISYYDDQNGMRRVAGFHSDLTEISYSQHELPGIGTIYTYQISPRISSAIAQYVFTIDCTDDVPYHYALGHVLLEPGGKIAAGSNHSDKGVDRDYIEFWSDQVEPWSLFQIADAQIAIGIPCPGKSYATLRQGIEETEGTIPTE